MKLPLACALAFLGLNVFSQVGIGTTNPSEILDIESNDATKTAIDLNNTSSGDPLIHFQVGGTTYFSIGVDNSDNDKFKMFRDKTIVDKKYKILPNTSNQILEFIKNNL